MRSIVPLLLLCGCVHHAPLSNDEKCAVQGMALEGVVVAESSAVVVGPNFVATGAGASSAVTCREPDESEQCLVDARQKSGRIKARFNESVFGRNMGEAAGFALFVLPGVAIHVSNENERDGVIARAKQVAEEGEEKCSAH